MATCMINTYLLGSKFYCLNFIFVDVGTKSYVNVNKTDTKRVSTTQRSEKYALKRYERICMNLQAWSCHVPC